MVDENTKVVIVTVGNFVKAVVTTEAVKTALPIIWKAGSGFIVKAAPMTAGFALSPIIVPISFGVGVGVLAVKPGLLKLPVNLVNIGVKHLMQRGVDGTELVVVTNGEATKLSILQVVEKGIVLLTASEQGRRFLRAADYAINAGTGVTLFYTVKNMIDWWGVYSSQKTIVDTALKAVASEKTTESVASVIKLIQKLKEDKNL